MDSQVRGVYIAGRGQSGSTFTDVLIGNAPEVESVGEVLSGLNRGPEEDCSCGVKVKDCEFWKSIQQHYESTYGGDFFKEMEWLYYQSDFRNLPKWWFTSIKKEGTDAHQYVVRNRQLFESIAAVSGHNVICDSNKEFSRAVMLLRGDSNARVLHLFRNPTSIIGSHYYRQKEKGMPRKFLKRKYDLKWMLFPGLMFLAVAWSVAMCVGVLLKWRFPKRVLHVSYENLCSQPEAEFQRIGEFLQVDMSDVIQGIAEKRPFPVGHNVGGSELRHEKTFTFIPNLKGRRKLPWHYRLGAFIATIPGRIVKTLFVRTA